MGGQLQVTFTGPIHAPKVPNQNFHVEFAPATFPPVGRDRNGGMLFGHWGGGQRHSAGVVITSQNIISQSEGQLCVEYNTDYNIYPGWFTKINVKIEMIKVAVFYSPASGMCGFFKMHSLASSRSSSLCFSSFPSSSDSNIESQIAWVASIPKNGSRPRLYLCKQTAKGGCS